jgi:hypothetical protein
MSWADWSELIVAVVAGALGWFSRKFIKPNG